MNYLNLTLCAALTAVLITAEHDTCGRWWKRNEIARRGLTVFDWDACGDCHIEGRERKRPYRRKGWRVSC